MIHSVTPVEDQQGWGNVMYIPASARCPRNEKYAASVREAFLNGDSLSDFQEEHYERRSPERFQLEHLNDTGRRGPGMSRVPAGARRATRCRRRCRRRMQLSS